MKLRQYYKLFLVYLFVTIFVSFGVFTVFSSDLVFEPQIKKIDLYSKNIYLDNERLKTNFVIVESKNNLSSYRITSSCAISSKFMGFKNNKNYFKIKYLDKKCKNPFVYLSKNNKAIKNSFIKLNLFSKQKLFDFYVDRNDYELKKLQKNFENLIQKNIEKLEELTNKDNTKKGQNISKHGNNIYKNSKEILEKIRLKRKIEEIKFGQEFLIEILKNRTQKYTNPVKGYFISNKKNKIPNAGRPYRQSYTDGVHHGWDIMAPLNTPVVSLDYGKIVRIVRNFKFSDLNKIKKYGTLSYEQKLRNLDLLRGNQVWLKTSKGDVVFYSHLQNIPTNLKVGDIVKRNVFLGHIGISGVPDRHYKDYHLHFAIMKNPHLHNKIGKYNFLDYMKWDWYFRKKSLSYILKGQNKIFK